MDPYFQDRRTQRLRRLGVVSLMSQWRAEVRLPLGVMDATLLNLIVALCIRSAPCE